MTQSNEEFFASIQSALEAKYGREFKRRDQRAGLKQYLHKNTIIQLEQNADTLTVTYFGKAPQRYNKEKKKRMAEARRQYEQLSPGTFLCDPQGCTSKITAKPLQEGDKL